MKKVKAVPTAKKAWYLSFLLFLWKLTRLLVKETVSFFLLLVFGITKNKPSDVDSDNYLRKDQLYKLVVIQGRKTPNTESES